MRRTVALLLASLALGLAAVASADEGADYDCCGSDATACSDISDEAYGRAARCEPDDAAELVCQEPGDAEEAAWEAQP